MFDWVRTVCRSWDPELRPRNTSSYRYVSISLIVDMTLPFSLLAWYQEHGAGVQSNGTAGRSFYTSLGHLNETWAVSFPAQLHH